MGTVNFYLKKPESANKNEKLCKLTPNSNAGKSLIYLQFKYSGYKLVFSFGQSINPKNWNPAKQRVKSNSQTTADGDHSLNELLDNLARICLKAYKEELKNGIPQPAVIKQHLIGFMNQNSEQEDKPTLFKLIDQFINNEIKFKGKNKADNTIDKYKTVKGHLKEFQTKTRYKVDFDTINLDFFYKYIAFLKTISQKDKDGNVLKVGLSQNTIAKDIQVIKTFMNEAFDLGYTTNSQHKHKKFTATWEDTDAVYLTNEEILRLYRHDLSSHPRLDKSRDLFVIGCYTGLRFSDYSDLKPEHIIKVDGEQFIKLVTQKTKDLAIIPCSPIVLQILNKYKKEGGNLPKAPSIQKFNDYIKEVCEIAGLHEKGRLMSDPDKELWECISSHTARRSFATNLFLEGYPTIEIMKITHHRTEKSFLKYIKVSKLEAARRLSKHMQIKIKS